MLALLFEVTPKPDGYQRYLDLAAMLRPALDKHDGFLFIDRYRSRSNPETILSHSLWRDEASLAAWRTFEQHHHAQVAGRDHVFADYRLRIAGVVLARTPEAGEWRPSRLSSYNEPGARPPRYLVIAASRGRPGGGETSGQFESLNRPNEFLSLYDAGGFEDARRLFEALARSTPGEVASETTSVRVCEVERDYGMFDRREAPQYYRPVSR
ncbi:MAG: antibiotic biosynthesis monooxygenase family protein [Bradyrhizobium sp.]